MTVAFDIASNAQPGEYTVVVAGQMQVPFGKDPKGGKPNTLTPLPSRPVRVVVTPAPKK